MFLCWYLNVLFITLLCVVPCASCFVTWYQNAVVFVEFDNVGSQILQNLCHSVFRWSWLLLKYRSSLMKYHCVLSQSINVTAYYLLSSLLTCWRWKRPLRWSCVIWSEIWSRINSSECSRRATHLFCFLKIFYDLFICRECLFEFIRDIFYVNRVYGLSYCTLIQCEVSTQGQMSIQILIL